MEKAKKSKLLQRLAEITTCTKSINTRVPKLIVKKLSKEDKNNIKGYVTKCLMTDMSIHTKGIIQKSEEELVITYVDE